MSSTSRLPMLVRCMHTSGRRISHPPLGGAGSVGPTGSTSPSTDSTPAAHTPPIPSDIPAGLPPTSTSALNDAATSQATAPEKILHSSSSIIAPRWTRGGKRIVVRPARQTPVQLPSGYPEPPTYPPPKEYYENLESKKEALHPLWKFFHVDIGAKSKLQDDENHKTEVPIEVGAVEVMRSREVIDETRSWSAAELRLKSFADLHTLWYILLRERNVLATQSDERRRLNINNAMEPKWMESRAHKVRKSMARIKYVLNERRLALHATLAPLAPPREPLPEHVDPTKSQAALWNETPYEDIRYPRGSERRSKSGGIINSEEVPESEIESRDEGFGGGKEAKAFVEGTKVDESGEVKLVEQ